MMNFHYEIRICQKVYNRVTTHNNNTLFPHLTKLKPFDYLKNCRSMKFLLNMKHLPKISCAKKDYIGLQGIQTLVLHRVGTIFKI
jgi:hypothetical protein